jgi:hypothetical protein
MRLIEKLFCDCGFVTGSESIAVRHVKERHCRSDEEKTNPRRLRDRVEQFISHPMREFSWNEK